MDVAEKVALVRPVAGSSRLLVEKGAAGGVERGFEIMANVIWEEVGRAIMDELGSVVFSAGRPNEFRKVCSVKPFFLLLTTLLAL